MREMSCREFDEVVHGFVHLELLDVSAREAALEHAARCEACAQRLADASALAELSETVGRRYREEESPAAIEASLLTAFRNHHRRAVWRRTVEWTAIGAAAAVLLIFLWTASGRSRGTPVPPPKKDVASEPLVPLEARAVPAPMPGAPEAAGASETASIADASSSGTYSASDFVPVPFTGAISADDPGMVVRVQLTRASLAQLGYPLAEAPDEDLISADVLVGEDGWPRGVKLIQ